VQVDPIKPTSKAPEIKLLKLKYDKMLSESAFKFNLRRSSEVETRLVAAGVPFLTEDAQKRAQPTDRGLHSFRCQLNFSSSVHRVTQLDS